MTTKIITLRLPVPLYSNLCKHAGEIGVPLAAHLKKLIEREHTADQIESVRNEMRACFDALTKSSAPNPALEETVQLARSIAAHLNPQMVAAVRAKLLQNTGA